VDSHGKEIAMTPETKNSQLSSEVTRRPSRLGTLKAALVATALTFAAGGVLFNLDLHPTLGTNAAAAPADRALTPNNRPATENPAFSFADLVQQVSPAVVSVEVEHTGNAQVADRLDQVPAPFRDFFRNFGEGQGREFNFGQRGDRGQGQRAPQLRTEARGSGFIIDADGYVVTNNHVIDGGSKITVKLADGRSFPAKLVGTDKDTDVALLKLDGVRNLPIVAFGDDQHLRVGDWVVAVGNPFGLGGTVTAGIVSSIGRDIGNGPYTDFLQIDAPINQGNSGGPTFDLSGRVVGMNTAIFSPSGGSVGIGFAIPASTIHMIVDQLRDHGSISRGWLGVQIQSVTPEMAASLGFPDTKGAIVASVVDNSPAAKAGLKQGDVIVSVDGKGLTDSRDLTRKVALVPAGSHVDFGVMRDGRKQNISVTIGKREEQQASATDRPGRGVRPSSENLLGMEMAPVTPETRDEYKLDDNARGVVVTSVDPHSDAATKGLNTGDVIVKMGTKDIHTPTDVRQSVADAKKAGRDSVLMLVRGMDGEHFVSVHVG
jgi:serine protease Do